MKVKDNVRSTIRPKEVEYDNNHVYVNSNICEIDNLGMKMYSYTVTKYDKDEFIVVLSNGQLILGERATMIENALLEISEVIYA